MNKEEKEAIRYLERHMLPYVREGKIKFMLNDVILNLINKQQREIDKCEYYKDHADLFLEENKKLKDELKKERALNKSALETLKECVHKDKIKAKMKEVAEEVQIYVDTEKFDIEFEKSNYTIDVLKELLGKRTLNSLYGTMTKESEDNK